MNYIYRNKEWLHNKYVVLEWSQSDIAAFCGCSQTTISNWIEKHNIKIRDSSECHVGNKNGSWVNSNIKDRNYLYNEYVIKKKSYRTIAKENKISLRTVARWIKKHNIDSRSSSEAKKLLPKKGQAVYKCEVCGKKTSYKKTQCLDCYHESRSKEPTKSDSISDNIRGYIKRNINPLVLKRDGERCLECDSKEDLCVHHIVPFSVIRDQIIMENVNLLANEDLSKLYQVAIKDHRVNDLDNLVTLCKKCHTGEHQRINNQNDDSVYLYYATVLDVKDGDTISVDIDLGFNASIKVDVRIYGVNTEELSSSDIHKKGKAILAKRAIKELCHVGRRVVLRTYKTGKYGRWLAVVYLENTNVNHFLIDSGLSRKYMV